MLRIHITGPGEDEPRLAFLGDDEGVVLERYEHMRDAMAKGRLRGSILLERDGRQLARVEDAFVRKRQPARL